MAEASGDRLDVQPPAPTTTPTTVIPTAADPTKSAVFQPSVEGKEAGPKTTKLRRDATNDLVKKLRSWRRQISAKPSRGSPFRPLSPDSGELLPGMWQGTAGLDLQRMATHVTMKLSGRRPQFPFGPGKWVAVPDLGLLCYATTTVINRTMGMLIIG